MKQATGKTDESGDMSPRNACLGIALALALFPACRARAQDPAPDARAEALRRQLERFEQQEAEEAAQRQQWHDREQERIDAVEKARKHLAEVEANRVRAKDGAHGGVKRSEWTRRAEEAQKDVDQAQRDLAELHEEARKAEVPSGWFQSDD